MLTIDFCLWLTAIMLTRYLSLSISSAAPLKQLASHLSQCEEVTHMRRDLSSGVQQTE